MTVKDTEEMFKRHLIFKGQMEKSDHNKSEERAIRNVFDGKEKHLASFLDSNPDFVYVYKKTERLIMATYMVTDILSDSDPLKNNVRESALGLLSATIFLKDERLSQKAVDIFHEGVLHVVSLLDISYATGRITEMNASVLKREFESLLEYANSVVEKKRTSPGDSSFSPSFFDVKKPEHKKGPHQSTGGSLDTERSSQSRSFDSQEKEISQTSTSKQISPKRSHVRPSGYIGNVAKNERRAAIFNLLREKKEITVRDLATVVTDCSVKTLQRELLQLVDEGILNKEGERRWSRYSLVI